MPPRSSISKSYGTRNSGISRFRDTVKTGFGLSIGGFFAYMIFLVIAMAFFIPGFILVRRQQEKEESRGEGGEGGEDPNTSIKVLGYVLMVIGMIVGLGFGASGFLTLLSNDI